MKQFQVINSESPEEEKARQNMRSKKEAKMTLGFYFLYFLWSILTAYGLGSGNPEEYVLIFGFPAWFFFSCILGYPLACIAVYFLVKKFFV